MLEPVMGNLIKLNADGIWISPVSTIESIKNDDANKFYFAGKPAPAVVVAFVFDNKEKMVMLLIPEYGVGWMPLSWLTDEYCSIIS